MRMARGRGGGTPGFCSAASVGSRGAFTNSKAEVKPVGFSCPERSRKWGVPNLPGALTPHTLILAVLLLSFP